MITLSNRKYLNLRRPVLAGDTVIPPGLSSIDTAYFAWTGAGTSSFTTRGPASTGFWIDWGDGSAPTWVAHLGTGVDVVTNHVYSGAGPYALRMIGGLSQITHFVCTDPELSGDIQGFRFFGFNDFFRLNGTNISGVIDGVVKDGITYLNLQNLNVSGNGNWLAVTSLSVGVYVSGTNIGFDIADLVNDATGNMAYCIVNDTSCFGDVTALLSVVDISSYLRIYNSGTFTCSVGAFVDLTMSTLSCYSCGFGTTDVDNFFNNLDPNATGAGTADTGGTNGAVSAASAASRTSLVGKGWILTYNV